MVAGSPPTPSSSSVSAFYEHGLVPYPQDSRTRRESQHVLAPCGHGRHCRLRGQAQTEACEADVPQGVADDVVVRRGVVGVDRAPCLAVRAAGRSAVMLIVPCTATQFILAQATTVSPAVLEFFGVFPKTSLQRQGLVGASCWALLSTMMAALGARRGFRTSAVRRAKLGALPRRSLVNV